MKSYARIQDGLVAEIIPPFERTEIGRPPAPADLDEDASDQERETHALVQALHDNWQLGEVPVEERFTAEIVATLVEVPADLAVDQGWTWNGNAFAAPVPYVAPPLTAEEAKAQRDALLTAANLRKNALQDAVDIDEATPAEIALLTLWKKYTVALTRLEEQAGFPESINWPVKPE